MPDLVCADDPHACAYERIGLQHSHHLSVLLLQTPPEFLRCSFEIKFGWMSLCDQDLTEPFPGIWRADMTSQPELWIGRQAGPCGGLAGA